jgi:hypothetical protein
MSRIREWQQHKQLRDLLLGLRCHPGHVLCAQDHYSSTQLLQTHMVLLSQMSNGPCCSSAR